MSDPTGRKKRSPALQLRPAVPVARRPRRRLSKIYEASTRDDVREDALRRMVWTPEEWRIFFRWMLKEGGVMVVAGRQPALGTP